MAQFPAQYCFAGVIEFFGGVLVAIGLFTGYAAFIVCGEMAVAYFQNHFPEGFWPILNTGARGLLLLTFLFISSRGVRYAGQQRSESQSRGLDLLVMEQKRGWRFPASFFVLVLFPVIGGCTYRSISCHISDRAYQ